MKATALTFFLLLVSCATPRMYVAHDCHGKEITVRFTQYVSPWPMLECPIQAAACGASATDVAALALQIPLACAYRGPLCSVVVLPVIGTEVVREHEYAHLRGENHDGGCV